MDKESNTITRFDWGVVFIIVAIIIIFLVVASVGYLVFFAPEDGRCLSVPLIHHCSQSSWNKCVCWWAWEKPPVQ